MNKIWTQTKELFKIFFIISKEQTYEKCVDKRMDVRYIVLRTVVRNICSTNGGAKDE